MLMKEVLSISMKYLGLNSLVNDIWSHEIATGE